MVLPHEQYYFHSINIDILHESTETGLIIRFDCCINLKNIILSEMLKLY